MNHSLALPVNLASARERFAGPGTMLTQTRSTRSRNPEAHPVGAATGIFQQAKSKGCNVF